MSNIQSARSQSGLYDFLTGSMSTSFPFDDILRFQWVYSVSAFDTLMHDIIRIGMVDTYLGNRQPTPGYQAETISIELHRALLTASLPPAEVLFEQEAIRKLKASSFQDPDKIAKGLSLIWHEQHKWQSIANQMGTLQNDLVTTLKLICIRRNAIVHEADMDPVTHARTPITKDETNKVSDLLENCGKAIVDLVS